MGEWKKIKEAFEGKESLCNEMCYIYSKEGAGIISKKHPLPLATFDVLFKNRLYF